METIEVKPGQVWADNDARVEGRTLRVDAVNGDKVTCTILTNDTDTQATIDKRVTDPDYLRGYGGNDRRGKRTTISLRRFRPTSTGYRLVTDTPEES